MLINLEGKSMLEHTLTADYPDHVRADSVIGRLEVLGIPMRNIIKTSAAGIEVAPGTQKTSLKIGKKPGIRRNHRCKGGRDLGLDVWRRWDPAAAALLSALVQVKVSKQRTVPGTHPDRLSCPLAGRRKSSRASVTRAGCSTVGMWAALRKT